jgi:hypothetical protein
MRRLLPLALVPVLAAGCLFGGATHYTAKKTTPCLKKHFKVFPQKVPASAAAVKLEALLGLDSPGHYVAFYKDEKAAKKAHVDFVHRAAQSGAAGSDTVEQQKNAVIILASEDRTQDSTILACLK